MSAKRDNLSMRQLEGRVALVTGAGQGVGLGVALALARAGAAVAAAGRTQAKLDATCARIAGAGGRAIPIPGDVKSAADLARMVEETVAQLGGLDVLVNN